MRHCFRAAQNLFSTMHHLAALPGQQLGLRPQTFAPAGAPLRWHGARKNLRFAALENNAASGGGTDGGFI
jgi:hypothetical protein